MEANSKVVKVAVVGLGQVGSRFISKLFEFEGKGLKIVAAAEKNPEMDGVNIARSKGITVHSSEDRITELGDEIDVIFDLTGDSTVGRNMKLAQIQTGNTHTVIVPRIVAVLIWNMFEEGGLLPEHTTRYSEPE